MDHGALETLVYWITEREAIRVRRESGEEPPWTDDAVLGEYRFCNVRRMDDRVSRWLMDNWYRPNFDSDRMSWACALARFINQPQSLIGVGYFVFEEEEVNWDYIYNFLRSAWDDEGSLFNPAYIVTGQAGVDKLHSVVYNYVRPLAEHPPAVDTDSMRRTWLSLQGRAGIASFMAGQIVADLRWAAAGRWDDRHWWAPRGPGSTRGMNRLWGRDKRAPMDQTEFVDKLQGMIDLLAGLLPAATASRLEAMDYQNCLCEFDKYMRAVLGEGRPKQKFVPREE